jgi:GDPmannose 4,6-dehydratase
MKKALITGIYGQDAFYLSSYLLAQGYKVFGSTRKISRERSLPIGIELFELDIQSEKSVADAIAHIMPDEVYCLAAKASSADLNNEPVELLRVNGISVVNFLLAIQRVAPSIKLCFASSSEVFAGSSGAPMNENSCLMPLNAYAAAKCYGQNIVKIYREKFGLYACSAILFNHESPLRPEYFVSMKIARAAVRIHLGLEKQLVLGDLQARRDWGHARDTTRAMYLMLQHSAPKDYVISTGKLHSVREMCEIAFSYLNLDYKNHVLSSVDSTRRREGNDLVGNSSRALGDLAWSPDISFKEMIQEMVQSQLNLMES